MCSHFTHPRQEYCSKWCAEWINKSAFSNVFLMQDTSQMFFLSKHYFVQKSVLFGNVFTCMKTLFGSDNTSQPEIQLGPLILLRLHGCVMACVTHVMQSPAMCCHVHAYIVTGHPKRKVYLVQKMVHLDNEKKILGHENCISIWHPPRLRSHANIICLKKLLNTL